MWEALANVTVWGVMIGLRVWASTRWRCDCGRSRWMYYEQTHERAWLDAVFATLALVLLAIGLAMGVDGWWTWLALVLMVLISVFNWRRWWFHEKDKMKRKAAKALGRVRLTSHGRLTVEPT